MHTLSEAEIQVLIALIELSQPIETPNNNFYRFHPQTMKEAAMYFKGFLADWSEAYDDLAQRGLLEPVVEGWALTAAGQKTAAELRRARPPIYYWYREYYTTAPHSPAYRRFCEELYGRFLCQANFSDMGQLARLVETLDLHPGERALDLGCGIGLIAEYLSDSSGAAFTGIDYCPDAIAQALERTAAKRQRLDFAVQNLDTLDFPDGSFNALIAIDTLYMPNDLDATLRKMAALLKPGGRMGIFYSTAIWDVGDERARLRPERTPLGEALTRVGLTFTTLDFSRETHRHLQRKHRIGLALRPAFEAEGQLGLYDYILAESDAGSAPFDPQTCAITRYLYRVEPSASSSFDGIRRAAEKLSADYANGSLSTDMTDLDGEKFINIQDGKNRQRHRAGQ
jgi:ubiquinone/menaquinone biosynthesis C-methylase UbiE